MKKVLIAIAVMMLGVFGLAACGNDNELVMYTNAAFPPFEYRADNGDVVGVDVDIMTEVAAAMGKKLKVNDVEFDTIIEKVKKDKNAVGAAGITRNAKREKEVDFSDTYYTAIQYILCREADADLYTDLASLSGKQIGTQLGTTGDLMIEGAKEGNEDYTKVIEGGKLNSYKDAPTAAGFLKANKIDVVIIDKLPAMAIAEKNPGLVAKQLVDSQAGEEAYGIIVTKGNSELLAKINEVLAKLIADKKIDTFVNNHYGNK